MSAPSTVVLMLVSFFAGCGIGAAFAVAALKSWDEDYDE
jgi:hypothetical protein